MKRGILHSKIPPEIRAQLHDDTFMSQCLLLDWSCNGYLQWHHAFSYAGKRVNELWSILPMCAHHHKEEAKHRETIDVAIFSRIKHFHAEQSFKEKYPKSTLLSTPTVL